VELLELIASFIAKSEAYEAVTLRLVKTAYDLDLCEEDAILQFHGECEDSKFKLAIAPFVEWLMEAEEDSDDDE
jgi:eIF4-gamma/eIF5/eIF2-epsilon